MSDIRLVASTVPNRKTSDGQFINARAMRDGSLVTVDWKQALMQEGRGFMLKVGDENAPVNSTTVIADTEVFALVDVASGTTVIPFFAQISVATHAGTSVLTEMMIEIDNTGNRFSAVVV